MSACKVVLVTGASRGIGAAVAELSARAGFDVAVNFTRDEAAAAQVVARVQALGRRAIAVRADVSKEADVLKMFATVDCQLGRLCALVNNAGVVANASKFQNMSVDRWQQMFAVNVIGTFLCAREAINRMALSKGGAGGTIVNLSSAASRIGSPDEYIDYAASKGAIDTFTLGLGKELANECIRVNAVRPGLINTEIHASGGFPDRVERNAPFVPMRRGGTADEVAEAVLWLMSEKSSFVTATLLDVAGGR